MEYSCGTAAIRGTKELGDGQHFWEIKMTSPVYGTDMVSGQCPGAVPQASAPGTLSPAPLWQMVGIGTSDVDLDKYHHTFCSLLGRDEDSWGLSYTGLCGPGVGWASREGSTQPLGSPSPGAPGLTLAWCPQGSSTTRATRPASRRGSARAPSLVCTWTPGTGR